jgi:hypothetical protein
MTTHARDLAQYLPPAIPNVGDTVRVRGITPLETEWGPSGTISDAPDDGLLYARRNLAWDQVPPPIPPDVQEAPTDGQLYGRENAAWTLVPIPPPPDVQEAPIDGQLYGRLDGAWGPIPTGGPGGGVPEAPLDGQHYARQNAAWQPIENLTIDAGTFP